jgi:EAL domain-containing protein (putative c-di-GMP-specific phosphodiesterase class I)
MRHPVHGIVGPGAFLPQLLDQGRIETLNQIILPMALLEFGQLKVLEETTLSLNITAESLGELSFPDVLDSMLKEAAVAPRRVVVEVTETSLVGNPGTSLDVLSRLRIKGLGVSVDDFGTGYSSLAQLRKVPATELKIDALFVKDLETDAASRAMVLKTIQLGHEMELRVVAEGNETLGQTNILVKQGCDIAQGYYFGRPIPFASLQRWIDDHPMINFQNPG